MIVLEKSKVHYIFKHKQMGHIKEPAGVDLNVGPMPFSAEDRQEVSAIIAQYKRTGKIPKLPRKSNTRRRKPIVVKNNVTALEKSTTVNKKSKVLESDK